MSLECVKESGAPWREHANPRPQFIPHVTALCSSNYSCLWNSTWLCLKDTDYFTTCGNGKKIPKVWNVIYKTIKKCLSLDVHRRCFGYLKQDEPKCINRYIWLYVNLYYIYISNNIKLIFLMWTKSSKEHTSFRANGFRNTVATWEMVFEVSVNSDEVSVTERPSGFFKDCGCTLLPSENRMLCDLTVMVIHERHKVGLYNPLQ